MSFYEKRRADGGLYVGVTRIEEPGFYKEHPPWTKSAVIRAAKGGAMPIRDISREFSVHERTISRWLRAAGVPKRVAPVFNALSDETLSRALELWQTPCHIDEIARLVGVHCVDPHDVSWAVRAKLERELTRRGMPRKLPRKPRYRPPGGEKHAYAPRPKRVGTFHRALVVGWAERRARGESWTSIAEGLPWSPEKIRDVTAAKKYQHPEWFSATDSTKLEYDRICSADAEATVGAEPGGG